MKCQHCGLQFKIPLTADLFPIRCRCGFTILSPAGDGYAKNEVPIPPNILERGRNYARAWWRWTKAGCPQREPDEVTRLRGICGACAYFDGAICTHRKCGCNVATGGWFGDKLAWATEHCPVDKW